MRINPWCQGSTRRPTPPKQNLHVLLPHHQGSALQHAHARRHPKQGTQPLSTLIRALSNTLRTALTFRVFVCCLVPQPSFVYREKKQSLHQISHPSSLSASILRYGTLVCSTALGKKKKNFGQLLRNFAPQQTWKKTNCCDSAASAPYRTSVLLTTRRSRTIKALEPSSLDAMLVLQA